MNHCLRESEGQVPASRGQLGPVHSLGSWLSTSGVTGGRIGQPSPLHPVQGFCVSHPKGRSWQKGQKSSDASLPSEVWVPLLLPWSEGDRSQSQASCPWSLVILCPSPHAFPRPLRLWTASLEDSPPFHGGWGAPLGPYPPTGSPSSEKSSCHQNMR